MDAGQNGRPLAVVTGASSGIGWAIARQLAERGHDLVIAAEDEELKEAAVCLEQGGAQVIAQQVDLAAADGVEQLYSAIAGTGRPVDAAVLNAGVGASGSFHHTPLEADLEVVDLNVRSVVHLTKLLLPAMVDEGRGRLLFTSSIAAFGPGPYHATYAASKAFVHLFAEGLRHELRGTGVTVTSLMPGPTDTAFFDRAEMRDTRIGRIPKDDPDEVARDAYDAMMAGRERVVAGSVLNRIQALGAGFVPDRLKAYVQAFLTKPQSGDR
ncbi:MAG: SDR family NAD(P)-dependent oxidoreductase [Nocardioidaceae bacterium]